MYPFHFGINKSNFVLTPYRISNLSYLLNRRFQVVLQPFEKTVRTVVNNETWLSAGSEVAMT